MFTLSEAKMLSHDEAAQTLTRVDAAGAGLASGLSDVQTAITSLEAMAHYLGKSSAVSLGKTGVMFANVAIEQLCATNRVALESLPIDAKRFDTAPQEALSAGVAAVGAATAQLVGKLGDDLVTILFGLAQKREAFNKGIRYAYHRLDEVQEQLDRIAQLQVEPKPTVSQFEVTDATRMALYGEAGMIANGGALVADVTHMLTTHTHLYKRLIAKQMTWINEHKDNILKDPKGFEAYYFNPEDYRGECNTDCGIMGELKVFRGNRLPGRMALTVHCTQGAQFGYEGAQGLLDSKCYLAHIPGDTPAVAYPKSLVRLSLLEIAARVAEIKTGLSALEHWCDMAYCKMWKDAFFDETLISYLLQKEAGSINERGLSMLSAAIVKLLNEATVGVAQYALSAISGLLSYVEQSTQAYSREGEE